MKGLSVFQITLFIVFGLIGVAGIIAIATVSRDGGGRESKPALVVWGVFPEEDFRAFMMSRNDFSKNYQITYIQKTSSIFERDLVEVLADNIGPDVVIIPEVLLARIGRKLELLPTEAYSERLFRDTFAEAASVYITPKGILGLPLVIDPLVMYWNRDHLSSAGIVAPPAEWSAFLGLSEQLTKRDKVLNIERSTVPFGEYTNVRNAKDILATFFLQTGSPIVSRDAQNRMRVNFNEGDVNNNQIASSLDFFAQFSNPTLPVYTWNRARPDSQEAFVGDTLTFYFGFSNELASIRSRNPNLNFDVTAIPQRRTGDTVSGMSHVYGVAALKSSPKKADAIRFMYGLVEKENAAAFAEETSMPPARRDLLAVAPKDAYKTSMYRSAIVSRTWLDPDYSLTADVFRKAVQSITVGSQTSQSAVRQIEKEINVLLGNAAF